jgi:hypothetical protein
MQSNEQQDDRGVPFSGEYADRWGPKGRGGLLQIKAWRATEFEAGRPSSLEDYFRANGFCVHCHGVGIALNENGIGHKAVGWQGEIQLFEKCEVCDGTGLQSSRAAGNG